MAENLTVAAPGMNLNVAVQHATEEALKSNLTARFLLYVDGEYAHVMNALKDTSDHFRSEFLLRTINPIILNVIGLGDKSFTHKTRAVIALPDPQGQAYICYDIFVEGCDEEFKRSLDETPGTQPIHMIEKIPTGFHMFRATWFENAVARDLAERKVRERGPKAHYADYTNNVFYDHAKNPWVVLSDIDLARFNFQWPEVLPPIVRKDSEEQAGD